MPSERDIDYGGRYSDGRTAATQRAMVRLGAHGVEIALPGADRPLIWAYAHLVTAVPLAAKAEDVLLQIQDPAEPPAAHPASVHVAGQGFAAALIGHAPGLTASRQRWRVARVSLLVTLALLVASIGFWATGVGPSRTIAGLAPQAAWRSIGSQMLTGFSNGRRECTDPAGRAALGRLMRRLVMDDDAAGAFDVHVVEWGLVNAFALPGRTIVLTSGLIGNVRSGDELAGVVAHEIGHGLERHPETAIVRLLGLATLAKMITSGSSDSVSNIGLLLVQLRYNREAEREADARAIAILRSAGIAAQPLGNFLGRLKEEEKKRGGDGFGVEMLRTHPSLDERIVTIGAVPRYRSGAAIPADDLATIRRMCTR